MQFAIPALQGLATVGGTVSNIRAGNAAARAGSAEAKSEILAAEYNAGLEHRKNQYILGKQRTIAAASGLDPNRGSLLDLALESSRQAAMDEEAIRYGGQTRAEQAKTQGRIAQVSLRNRGIAAGTAGLNTIASDWYTRYGGAGAPSLTTGLNYDVPEFRYQRQPLKFSISG